MDVVAAFSPAATPSVVSRLRSSPWYVTRNLTIAMGRRREETTLPVLQSLLQHDHAKVRREAIIALGASAPPRRPTPWSTVAQSSRSSPEERSLAARAMEAAARPMEQPLKTRHPGPVPAGPGQPDRGIAHLPRGQRTGGARGRQGRRHPADVRTAGAHRPGGPGSGGGGSQPGGTAHGAGGPVAAAGRRQAAKRCRSTRRPRGAELADWLAAALRGEVPGTGGAIRAGSFELEDEAVTPAGEAETAAGYLSLLPGVRETLSEFADERQEGMSRARDIVRVIAGQVATGEKLFDPIRDLKAHDDYTFTHALNVCVLTTGMCRVLGMAEALVDTVSLAALCHDIGKEKVPSEILNKQGPLDAEETEIMNRHPAEGAAVLLRLPEKVHPLLPIVAFQHHRHADGSGYPARPANPGPHPGEPLGGGGRCVRRPVHRAPLPGPPQHRVGVQRHARPRPQRAARSPLSGRLHPPAGAARPRRPGATGQTAAAPRWWKPAPILPCAPWCALTTGTPCCWPANRSCGWRRMEERAA